MKAECLMGRTATLSWYLIVNPPKTPNLDRLRQLLQTIVVTHRLQEKTIYFVLLALETQLYMDFPTTSFEDEHLSGANGLSIDWQHSGEVDGALALPLEFK